MYIMSLWGGCRHTLLTYIDKKEIYRRVEGTREAEQPNYHNYQMIHGERGKILDNVIHEKNEHKRCCNMCSSH